MAMWRLALRIMQPLSIITSDRTKSFWNIKAFKYSLVPVACTSIFYYLHHQQFSSPVYEDVSQSETFFGPTDEGRVVSTAKYILRFIQLGIIFTPTIICLPLYLFRSTRDWWLSIFLNAVTRAGIVWIKAFQYLSHRRDIIGQEMAGKFSVLREHSPQHELEDTEKIIKRIYGKDIGEMFEEFNTTPIASGSVSQVYKAKLNGKAVAVKVRHPKVGQNLERDIDLLFIFSRMFAKLSKIFDIPITEDSLKKILSEQLCFLKEKRNIDSFNKLVVDRNIRFPVTYEQSTNQVLIEQFIDGETIGFYQTHVHNMNKVIANIGAKAFFSMLMKHNFVHADCHAGNILVKIRQDPNSVKTQLLDFFNRSKNWLISQVIKYGFDSQLLRRLSEENYEYEKDVQEVMDQFKERVEIILIDVGMAIRLTKEKKKNFQNFLAEIIKGDPIECAKWIYRVSQYNGMPLKEFENQSYLNDLEVMFRRVHKTTLESLQGIEVLYEMLDVIRDHNMKIDGEISILLTNMLVLQSIAKDLDPSINILRCAVPYLQYR